MAKFYSVFVPTLLCLALSISGERISPRCVSSPSTVFPGSFTTSKTTTTVKDTDGQTWQCDVNPVNCYGPAKVTDFSVSKTESMIRLDLLATYHGGETAFQWHGRNEEYGFSGYATMTDMPIPMSVMMTNTNGGTKATMTKIKENPASNIDDWIVAISPQSVAVDNNGNSWTYDDPAFPYKDALARTLPMAIQQATVYTLFSAMNLDQMKAMADMYMV